MLLSCRVIVVYVTELSGYIRTKECLLSADWISWETYHIVAANVFVDDQALCFLQKYIRDERYVCFIV